MAPSSQLGFSSMLVESGEEHARPASRSAIVSIRRLFVTHFRDGAQVHGSVSNVSAIEPPRVSR
jgi:hypothetical protein